MEELGTIVGAVVVVCGTVGTIVVALARRWVNSAVTKAEQSRAADVDAAIKEFVLQQQYQSAVGRYVFWLNRGIEKYKVAHPEEDFWNGELEKAYNQFQDAEGKLKSLHNNELARLQNKK